LCNSIGILGRKHPAIAEEIHEALRHMSAQGARVAVLEAERNATLVALLGHDDESPIARAESVIERLSAAEEGNRDLVRRAQQAESLLALERTRHKETSEMHSQEQLHGDIKPWTRYPCSSTCTHDDARTPGHPERVKERSEAVEVLRAADSYAEGAEAMRAACWEAVQALLRQQGFTPDDPLWVATKGVIEGAAP
jgi:hypothetical protein